MRTIIRDNYDPKNGDYHDKIIIDEARGRRWLFDCDGVFMPFDGVEVVNERGSSTNKAVSQKLFTDTANELEGADATLQQEIDELKNSPDVVDIVGTYADLQSYDTSTLGDKDVIRVLVDETHDNESSYYRWNATPQTWTFIGAVEGYYTKDQTDELIENAPAFKPFPDSVVTDGTTQQFMSSILALQPETGMAYIGTVELSDMPTGLIQEEVEVYVYSDYVIYCIMRSTDVSPYAWWCASYNYQGWKPVSAGTTYTAGTNINISSENVISATDTTYTAGTGLDLTGTSFSVDYTTTQPKLTAGANISIDSNNEISATDTTYSDFVGTDGTAAGTAGLVPAPATTDSGKFLKADGTWDTAGGGGPTVVQTTGTSTTNVMSQNATTNLVFPDASDKSKISIYGGTVGHQSISIGGGANYSTESVAIGAGASTSGTSGLQNGSCISIGYMAKTNGNTKRGITLLGANATSSYNHSVGLGSYSMPTAKGQVDISTLATTNTNGYNNSQYRLITGVYDGQSAHDAATKGQLDAIAITNAGAPTTSTVGTVGQILEDTTNGKLYICTDATNPYVWEEVGGSAGPTITMTTTDPGEGAALAANNFIAVYDETPLNLDYSTSEVNTGTVWVDGSAIYKKSVLHSVTQTGDNLTAHGISNLGTVTNIEGMLSDATDFKPLSYNDGTSVATTYVGSTNICTYVQGNDPIGRSGYVTIYYTKSS